MILRTRLNGSTDSMSLFFVLLISHLCVVGAINLWNVM